MPLIKSVSVDIFLSDLPRVIAQEREDKIGSQAKTGAGEAGLVLPSPRLESNSKLQAKGRGRETSGTGIEMIWDE